MSYSTGACCCVTGCAPERARTDWAPRVTDQSTTRSATIPAMMIPAMPPLTPEAMKPIT